ncbi:molecular chaperone DnaJ [Myxococcaceae bacterium JPH2]|nr:molecular chaperone DnaJ [Myxococcaceae bacterium JPH2]
MAKGGQTPPGPGSEEMRAAWARKDAGDVVGARREAERILSTRPSPVDEDEARALLRATSTPPSLYRFAALAAAIFVVLLLLALTRYA